MVYIWIDENDIENFSKLTSNTWYDDIVVTYYNNNTNDESLIMVSLRIDSFIGLCDRNKLKKISLLTN